MNAQIGNARRDRVTGRSRGGVAAARRRCCRRGRRRRCRCRRRTWAGALEPEGDVAEVPRSGVADERAPAGHGVDGVNSVAGPRHSEQNAIGAHTETIILLVHRHGVDAVGINRRDSVQRCKIKA